MLYMLENDSMGLSDFPIQEFSKNHLILQRLYSGSLSLVHSEKVTNATIFTISQITSWRELQTKNTSI